MSSSPAAAAAEEDSGGWGLSYAFGGWGLTAAAGEHVTTSDGEGKPTSKTKFEDDEWRRQTREVEDAVASAGDQVISSVQGVEDTLDETAKMAAAAASSFFSGASNYLLSGGDSDSAAAVSEPDRAAAANDGGGNDNSGGTEDPGALASILEYNPLNNLASQWINDLERKANADDPHRSLRQHLDAHLKDWPNATYEEWVEESLVALEKWDRDSAVVDDTFYLEGNVHRNLWNERMAAEENRCVPAKKSQSATTTTATAASAQPSNTLPAALKETGTVIKASKDARTASAAKETTSVTQAAAALLNDDADLDGLLGDDDDEGEICFVESPSS